MCFLNVVKCTCAIMVVCLEMNVLGMEQGKIGSCSEIEGNSKQKALALYDKYFSDESEDSFLLWKEDLDSFVTNKFQEKMCSSNATERDSCIGRVKKWVHVSNVAATLGNKWWGVPEIRDKAKNALFDAKYKARRYNNPALLNEINTVIRSAGF